jgi:hypothetical protein
MDRGDADLRAAGYCVLVNNWGQRDGLAHQGDWESRFQQSFAQLRAYQSLGKRLHQYLSNWSTSPKQPVVPGDIADRLGELLAELNKRKQMRPPYIEWTSHLPAACNKCGVSFAADRSELRNRRGMACRGCKRLHFWTGDE